MHLQQLAGVFSMRVPSLVRPGLSRSMPTVRAWHTARRNVQLRALVVAIVGSIWIRAQAFDGSFLLLCLLLHLLLHLHLHLLLHLLLCLLLHLLLLCLNLLPLIWSVSSVSHVFERLIDVPSLWPLAGAVGDAVSEARDQDDSILPVEALQVGADSVL